MDIGPRMVGSLSDSFCCLLRTRIEDFREVHPSHPHFYTVLQTFTGFDRKHKLKSDLVKIKKYSISISERDPCLQKRVLVQDSDMNISYFLFDLALMPFQRKKKECWWSYHIGCLHWGLVLYEVVFEFFKAKSIQL